MNKILLITTIGCAGCVIMRTAINSALIAYKNNNKNPKEIILQVEDFSNLYDDTIKELNPTDFPYTVFYKDDKIVRTVIGSQNYRVILKWLSEAYG